MKRTLSLVLALVMVLGSFTTVFAAPAAVEVDAAEFLEAVGVLQGNDDGDLMLENNLERRDAVILLSRLLGVEDEAAEFLTTEESPSWEDARTDAYYVPFFAWAEENGYFEGDDEGNFNPRNAITAQEYALVLLRAMGYEADGHDAWKAALETAGKLGLLADVEVEDKDEVVRGQMAVMTLNALEAEGGKLAEELGIELPKPAVLEVEAVYADNLKQVVVEFNQKVEEKSATNLDNYTFADVKEAELLEDGMTVVLTLKEDKDLTNQKEYKLTAKDVLSADAKVTLAKVEVKFVAVDVTIPTVKEVIGLGTKAIQVIFSEPVKQDTARKMSAYKIDDKVISGSIKYDYPNSVIISTSMTVGDHKLSVKDVEDFNKFKVQETGFEFTVAEDNDAPEIISVKSNDLKEVEVTFNEPVKAVSNGYHTSKANTAKKPIKISGNKVTLEFGNSMSLGNTTIYVDGVEDYSGNKADRTTVVTPELDLTRPEVAKVEVENGNEFKIVFNKKIDKEVAKETKNYVIKDADGKVPTGVGLNSKGNPVSTKAFKVDDKEVTFELRENLKKGSYTIEISGIQDTAHIANTMFPHTESFDVGDTTELKISDAWTKTDDKIEYIYIQFNKTVATEGKGNALDLAKYNYTKEFTKDGSNSWLPIPVKATIELEAEDTVKIAMPKQDAKYGIDGVRVTLVTDLEENSFKDSQAENGVRGVEDRKVKLDSAKVTEQDTIEVTFDSKVESILDNDFRLVDVAGDVYYEVYFENFKNAGQTVAIFRTVKGDVGEDTDGWKFATVAKGTDGFGTRGSFDAELVENTTGVDAKDAIKPTLKKIVSSGNNKIVLEFNEAVKTDNAITLGLTVKVDSENPEFAIKTVGETIEITVEGGFTSKNVLRVILEDVSDITDKAGNMAEGFDEYIYN